MIPTLKKSLTMIAAVTLPTGLCLLAATSDSRASMSSTTNAASVVRAVEAKGVVDGWSVDGRGAVSIRIKQDASDAAADGVASDAAMAKQKSLWFTTPPSKTERTQLEHMMIVVALVSKQSGARVVARGESSGADGSSPEKGFDLKVVTSVDD
ncbi:MAG TPA: hypothetical protein PKE00_17105 [Planctomycetota bacterium]|nr:hypothetical protein [Planctomycetota bacterium]